MDGPTVSLIVPVHNAESFLPTCLNSLLRQSYPALDIILVENGSTDGSAALCRRFAQQHANVRVFQSAPGVSLARNTGLGAARGDLVQFVDADDHLEPDAVQLLVQTMLDIRSDLVVASYYRVINGVARFHNLIDEAGTITKPHLVELLLRDPSSYYWSVLWNKIYRLDLIRAHKLRFLEDIGWSEDLLFNLNYFQAAGAFFAIPQPVYYYVKNRDSITAQPLSPKEVLRIRRIIFDSYVELLRQTGLEERYRLQLYKFYFSHAEHR